VTEGAGSVLQDLMKEAILALENLLLRGDDGKAIFCKEIHAK
jgi:hypothetical protein